MGVVGVGIVGCVVDVVVVSCTVSSSSTTSCAEDTSPSLSSESNIDEQMLIFLGVGEERGVQEGGV